MNEKFCEHVQKGEARIYQRLEAGGITFHNCWKCAERLNPLCDKVQDLMDCLSDIAGVKPAPKVFTRSHK